MTTTTLAFGDSTLLGMTYAPQASHATATRATFQALPTMSYAGTATSFGVSVSISGTPLVYPNPQAVVYLTSFGATGSATDGTNPISTGYSFGQGTIVTFTAASVADLQDFMRGIYIGDNSPTSVSDGFRLTIQVDDHSGAIGRSDLYYDVTCYRRGTGIATGSGEVAVEDLRIGDLVRTMDGGLKPVKFIGTQSFEAAFVAASPAQRPVLIRKDAIGEGLPARDLYVSAMHSLFIDDVLVPAVALVNGVSILRAEAPEGVDYFHVELDEHQVILAEGLPAESFIDDDSRAIFDNAYEYEALYGEGPRLTRFAPRIEEGYQLDAIRRRIAARAGIELAAEAPEATLGHVERLEGGVLEGWVMDQAAEAPVEIDILVDGEVVGRALANRYRSDLDHAGLAGGRCAFTMALPGAAVSLDQVEVRIAGTGALLPKPVPTLAL